MGFPTSSINSQLEAWNFVLQLEIFFTKAGLHLSFSHMQKTRFNYERKIVKTKS